MKMTSQSLEAWEIDGIERFRRIRAAEERELLGIPLVEALECSTRGRVTSQSEEGAARVIVIQL